MVPFLTREHVESSTEDKITHTVESKPEKHISHVGRLSRAHVFVDTAFQLVYEGYDSLLVIVQCCWVSPLSTGGGKEPLTLR